MTTGRNEPILFRWESERYRKREGSEYESSYEFFHFVCIKNFLLSLYTHEKQDWRIHRMPPQYVVGIPSDESHYDSILPKRLLRKFKMSIGL